LPIPGLAKRSGIAFPIPIGRFQSEGDFSIGHNVGSEDLPNGPQCQGVLDRM